MFTKRQLVLLAFEELGLASYVFDMEPEQLQSAVVRMDLLVGSWEADGVTIGYPASSSPATADLNTEVTISDVAAQAIYKNLALSLAPTLGKKVSPETKVSARTAYRNLLKNNSTPINRQLPETLPRGAGNRTNTRQPFFPKPNTDPLQVDSGGNLDFLE